MDKYFDKIQELASKYSIKYLILFGSRAKNKHRSDSDWDFAYYPYGEFTAENHISLFDELSTLLSTDKIDLINISTSKNFLVIKNIYVEGKVIFEFKRGLFNSKRWDAWIMYQDFKKYQDIQTKLTKKRLQELANE